MSTFEAELEREAEELEKQAKAELAKKNYDLALLFYMDAKDIYTQLGFRGQIGIIEKQMQRIKRLMELEKPSEPVSKEKAEKKRLEDEGNQLLIKAKNLTLEKKYEDALKIYEKALEIFNKLGFNYQCKQINWQINKIKDFYLKGLDDVDNLMLAEQKESKRVSERIKAIERGSVIIKEKVGVSEIPEWKKKELEEREKKLRQIQEQKKREERMVKEADDALEQAKLFVDKKEFDKAKEFYKKAMQIFSNLGWHQQAEVIRNEIINLDKYKKAYEEKLKQDALKRKQQEIEFQKRVESILEEKKKEEEEQLAKLRALPPELQNKIQRARQASKKAEKEAAINKIERAIGRLEYAIELLESIPREKIDLTNEINNLKQKISDLKAKK
ncbi:MAG: hypothetical protein ACP6IY_07140 [Promethearchaeia archaeon]